MFYAMAADKIDLMGYRFEHTLQDIQTLNERAIRGELHLSAVSIHAYAYLLDSYALLPCGASMGDGYGPMFVCLQGQGLAVDASEEKKKTWLRSKKIAVPGLMTSAYLSAQLYLGKEFNHIVVPFDEIFEAIRSGSVDIGLIIHEGQLTYAQEGFEKVADMGEWFKGESGLPLPLGGNVIRKDFTQQQRRELNTIMKESIRYGLEHRRAAVDHSMAHARGMEVPLADEFIGMYVNNYTLDYGDSGRAAIREFLGRAADQGLVPRLDKLEFVS